MRRKYVMKVVFSVIRNSTTKKKLSTLLRKKNVTVNQPLTQQGITL